MHTAQWLSACMDSNLTGKHATCNDKKATRCCGDRGLPKKLNRTLLKEKMEFAFHFPTVKKRWNHLGFTLHMCHLLQFSLTLFITLMVGTLPWLGIASLDSS